MAWNSIWLICDLAASIIMIYITSFESEEVLLYCFGGEMKICRRVPRVCFAFGKP